MKSRTLNMTEGNPVRLLLAFSLPMLIGNIFQQIYNLVDSIIVGRFVGAGALAAVGATSSLGFLFFALCNGISNGGGIITSQHFGAGDEEQTKKSIVNSGYLMLVISAVVCLIAYFSCIPILKLMDTPADIMSDASVYMKMQCLGVPFIAVYNYAAAMLRALGDSKTPLYFLVIACIINAILDVAFVYGLGMGVFGAALATIIGQLLAGAGCLLYAFNSNSYFRFQRQHFRLEMRIIWEAIRLGVPLSLQFALISLSCMALQTVVNAFGANAVAAFTATNRIEQLMHQPYGSLCAALATFSGQNLGAGRMDRVKEGFKRGFYIMAVFSLIMLPVMQFGGEFIIKIFVDDQQIIQMGATALRITSWFYLALGTINVTRGILNGIGDAFFALQNGVVEMVGRLTIPIAITSISFIGIWGIWWSTGAIWVISALFCLVRYYSWRKKLAN